MFAQPLLKVTIHQLRISILRTVANTCHNSKACQRVPELNSAVLSGTVHLSVRVVLPEDMLGQLQTDPDSLSSERASHQALLTTAIVQPGYQVVCCHDMDQCDVTQCSRAMFSEQGCISKHRYGWASTA